MSRQLTHPETTAMLKSLLATTKSQSVKWKRLSQDGYEIETKSGSIALRRASGAPVSYALYVFGKDTSEILAQSIQTATPAIVELWGLVAPDCAAGAEIASATVDAILAEVKNLEKTA